VKIKTASCDGNRQRGRKTEVLKYKGKETKRAWAKFLE
jgi:hypothetical protein